MALGTLADYYAFAGGTADGGTADASLSAILAQTERAIYTLCRPCKFEPVTESWTRDAPHSTPDLILPAWPIRSIASLYYRPAAYGVLAQFTADYLLAEGTGFVVDYDMEAEGWSKSRKVTRLNQSLWGRIAYRPPGRLGWEWRDEPKCVRVTAAVGYTSVPQDVAQALYLATSMIYTRRKTGIPVGSASLNGASYGNAGQFTATAAVNSPDVRQLLSAYITPVGVA